MSDVVIRGMEMPKSCDECRLFNESWCMALGIENWRKSYNKPPEGGRLPDCPLLPLPEGHGRLIDADALRTRMYETMDYQDLYLPIHFEMCIGDVPTIIEAEGSVNDGT